MVALVLVGAVGAGCGSSSGTNASAPATTAGSASTAGPASLSAPKSCSGSGANRAGLVVEVSPTRILTRCVAFTGASAPALSLIQRSGVEAGTQKFSFGVAICQMDDVPAHYSKCLPSGQNYWALFLSGAGGGWTSPSTGISQISVQPGQWLGFRYDPPTGTPAPPPAPARL